MPLNLQDYLLLQHLVLLIQHLVLVTESNIHMKSYTVHEKFSRKLKKTLILKIYGVISLCVE